MWAWYFNQCPWTIQRILRAVKNCGCSGFYEPLHNGSTCIPTSLIHYGEQLCLQVINDQRIWRGFLTKILFAVSLKNEFWCQINPWPHHYYSVLGIYVFPWSWGSVVENSVIFSHFHSYFQHHIYASIFTCCHPQPTEGNFISCCCIIVNNFPQHTWPWGSDFRYYKMLCYALCNRSYDMVISFNI